jgi:DNA-binding CsgD family transcriptional regulator
VDARDEADGLLAVELERARRSGSATAIGAALRAQGVLHHDQPGTETLEEAAAILERSPDKLERARALADLGAALRRTNQRAAAREPLRRALDLAHRCGAIPLADRAREELIATGARPRHTVLSGIDALTVSERRVARMAAEGLSNREIAQALFVSMNTVTRHLTHAYQKLDISRRSELVAALSGAADSRT